MITDPHDPRQFRRYVTVNVDGSIAAVHDFDASVESPLPLAVEVTDVAPTDFTNITIDPIIATAVHVAADDVALTQTAIVTAQKIAAQASDVLAVAQAAARAALSASVAKAAAAPAVAVPING